MAPNGTTLEPAKALIDQDPKRFWHDYADKWSGQLRFTFSAEATVDRVLLQEPIAYGQRIKKFKIHTADRANGYKVLAEGTTIGNGVVVKIPPTKLKEIWVEIDEARAAPALNRVQFFNSQG